MKKYTDTLREYSKSELLSERDKLAKEILNLNIQKATGQLKQRHQIKLARRNVARVETILHTMG